jgi:hypothetical protein
VILLLLLGWLVKQFTKLFDIHLPNLSPLLTIFGTIGLILIVLEGALELELDKSKVPVIKKSFFVAALPIFGLSFLFAWAFHAIGAVPFRLALLNAIPLAVISSAIAIPSAKNLQKNHREFIIYESSLSDIVGVLFFNFIATNTQYGVGSYAHFGFQLLIIGVISFVATAGLALLLRKIDHHIKFVPIILLIILIYAVSKAYHLPGLVFIMIFGLFLGNMDELKRFNFIRKLAPDLLDREVHKFKDLTIEATFVVRALFFLLFGYHIRRAELLNVNTLLWAGGIVAAIFIVRYILLRLAKLPSRPLLFIAPRGLITILLFLSIPPESKIPLVNQSLVIQAIILTALVMMVGVMAASRGPKAGETPVKEV